MVVIKSLGEIPEIETMLKSYDYENRGQQGVSDRYFFVKGPEDARSHYVHFVEPNSNTYYNQVYFKKYLVEHPEYIKSEIGVGIFDNIVLSGKTYTNKERNSNTWQSMEQR